MGAGAIVTRADGTDVLGRVVGVAVQESPSRGRGDVGDGSLGAILGGVSTLAASEWRYQRQLTMCSAPPTTPSGWLLSWMVYEQVPVRQGLLQSLVAKTKVGKRSTRAESFEGIVERVAKKTKVRMPRG